MRAFVHFAGDLYDLLGMNGMIGIYCARNKRKESGMTAWELVYQQWNIWSSDRDLSPSQQVYSES